MKELLYTVVKALVNDESAIVIREATSTIEDQVILHLKVAAPDMGRVIGKQGKIIRSIRTIVRAYAKKNGIDLLIEVDEADQVASELV